METNRSIKEVISELRKFELLPTLREDNFEELRKDLSARINFLITHNFDHLIFILYRLDISEKKLMGLLRRPTTGTAGEIIANMIVERQLQKIASRKAFKTSVNNISDDEKW